jgi:MSHA pilin protein MshD
MCGISRSSVRGVTLVELIVFIVIVGVAMAGVFAAFNTITAASADPQVRKQMLAIAESLMEEIQLMPFTFCDPDDPQAATAQDAVVGATGCTAAASVENLGAETTAPYGPETRYSASNPFDNVNDYDTFFMNDGSGGIKDITGSPINVSGLAGYSVTVSVSQAGLGLAPNAIAAADALLISVTVSHSGQLPVQLEGYRTRYAPTTVP